LQYTAALRCCGAAVLHLRCGCVMTTCDGDMGSAASACSSSDSLHSAFSRQDRFKDTGSCISARGARGGGSFRLLRLRTCCRFSPPRSSITFNTSGGFDLHLYVADVSVALVPLSQAYAVLCRLSSRSRHSYHGVLRLRRLATFGAGRSLFVRYPCLFRHACGGCKTRARRAAFSRLAGTRVASIGADVTRLLPRDGGRCCGSDTVPSAASTVAMLGGSYLLLRRGVRAVARGIGCCRGHVRLVAVYMHCSILHHPISFCAVFSWFFPTTYSPVTSDRTTWWFFAACAYAAFGCLTADSVLAPPLFIHFRVRRAATFVWMDGNCGRTPVSGSRSATAAGDIECRRRFASWAGFGGAWVQHFGGCGLPWTLPAAMAAGSSCCLPAFAAHICHRA
jgi:hypothetical protein